MMSTGFQAAIQGRIGQQGFILHRADGVYFGMGSSKLMMIAFPNDMVIMHNNATYQWIGPGHSQSFPGQLETAAHVYFIYLCMQDAVY
jgi:hypothetical protein